MPAPVELEPISFSDIEGFASDDLCEAFAVFHLSATRIAAGEASQRLGVAADAALLAASRAALALGSPALAAREARCFFETWFRPFRLPGPGFVTAYYEPEVEARLEPEPDFTVPVLARPPDLVTLNEVKIATPGGALLSSARRLGDGSLVPYPDRAAIEDGPDFEHRKAIAFVRDRIELFMMQVQGSARLRLPAGSGLSLTYDGRNGYPYTSIGRLLIERGLIAPADMSLAKLKETIRSLGQAKGQPGCTLMQENQSFVFFRRDDSADRARGPIGGQGCALTPLRSIAIDRSIWPYGLPFWIETRAPWRGEEETRLERLMIAQDTGSAILGRARADLFFGSGDRAGFLAGRVRHKASFTVLLPRGGAPE